MIIFEKNRIIYTYIFIYKYKYDIIMLHLLICYYSQFGK